MDPKYKTLIPLVVIFFIIGIAVGYAAHKPRTIEKIEYVENKTIVTVTVTVTPIPSQTLTPALTPISTAAATPGISNFTIKNYDPSTDTPTKTMVFQTNYVIEPNQVSIRSGESVLIKITEWSLPFSLTLVLNNSYQKYLGGSGSAFVTFNKKGTYSVEGIIPSDDPSVKPKTYATGTITVY
ncbi:MAG: hypothetical protein PHU34_05315 [Candidatus Methanoperedens sp.]|nr:hypothetical protein [Candidatus Methanoperedens sp.]